MAGVCAAAGGADGAGEGLAEDVGLAEGAGAGEASDVGFGAGTGGPNAFIVVAMQNYLAQVGQWVTVIQGVIFVVCVLAFRRGVIGEIAHYLRIKL